MTEPTLTKEQQEAIAKLNATIFAHAVELFVTTNTFLTPAVPMPARIVAQAPDRNGELKQFTVQIVPFDLLTDYPEGYSIQPPKP